MNPALFCTEPATKESAQTPLQRSRHRPRYKESLMTLDSIRPAPGISHAACNLRTELPTPPNGVVLVCPNKLFPAPNAVPALVLVDVPKRPVGCVAWVLPNSPCGEYRTLGSSSQGSLTYDAPHGGTHHGAGLRLPQRVCVSKREAGVRCGRCLAEGLVKQAGRWLGGGLAEQTPCVGSERACTC